MTPRVIKEWYAGITQFRLVRDVNDKIVCEMVKTKDSMGESIWQRFVGVLAEVDVALSSLGGEIEAMNATIARMKRDDEQVIKNALVTEGVGLIAEERRRVLCKKGYGNVHDDDHTGGELAIAAVCYVAAAVPSTIVLRDEGSGLDPWPWEKELDKRCVYPRKEILVIAGQFIAAEIDRLLRKEEMRHE